MDPALGRVAGLRAIVTGAANGQGRAVVSALASQGARVAALDHDRDGLHDLVADVGEARCLGLRTDVAVEQEVERSMREACQWLRGLDALYNNAGIYLRDQGDGRVETVEASIWNRVLAVNLGSVYLCCKHAIPTMAAGGGGAIVNVASTAALVASEYHAYSASKGAVLALTRSIAGSYASAGIRCNAIAPGVVETAMVSSILSDTAARQRFVSATPLGRFASANEIAALAVFLLSNEASYITGAVIPVDGGITAR